MGRSASTRAFDEPAGRDDSGNQRTPSAPRSSPARTGAATAHGPAPTPGRRSPASYGPPPSRPAPPSPCSPNSSARQPRPWPTSPSLAERQTRYLKTRRSGARARGAAQPATVAAADRRACLLSGSGTEVSQPWVLGLHPGKRLPKPGALWVVEGGEERVEVLLVAGPEDAASPFDLGGGEMPAGLVEKDSFRGRRLQPPGGLSDTAVQRNGDVRFPVEDPVVVGTVSEQELNLQGGMGRGRRG